MNRQAPTSVYVFVGLLAAALIYMLTCLPHGDGNFNPQQTIKEQSLQDAQRDLEDAQRRIQKYNK